MVFSCSKTHLSRSRLSDFPLASPLAPLVLIDQVDVVIARLLRGLVHGSDGRLFNPALRERLLFTGFQLDVVAVALSAGKSGDALTVAGDALAQT